MSEQSDEESETVKCRLCGHTVEGDSYGEALDALEEHGEEAHEWDDTEGWSA